MPCTELKAFGILNFGCVIPHCVFSSVYYSKREMSYSERSPHYRKVIIIHSRNTNAKKARENTRGARPLCQGLQPVQLRVPRVPPLNVECLHESAMFCSSQSQRQKVLQRLLLGGCWCYFASTANENFKIKIT